MTFERAEIDQARPVTSGDPWFKREPIALSTQAREAIAKKGQPRLLRGKAEPLKIDLSRIKQPTF